MKRAFTIRIDSGLFRELKSIASRERRSVKALIARELKALVRRLGPEEKSELSYEEARRHALALLEEGWDLGYRRPASRDELHER